MKTRSMLNLAMLAAMGREHELRLHIVGALSNGVTKNEMAEIFIQVATYAGFPAAVSAFQGRPRRLRTGRLQRTGVSEG